MKTEIYKIIRSACVSDMVAENAAEKVMEWLNKPCSCTPDETTGWTTWKLCNICGKEVSVDRGITIGHVGITLGMAERVAGLMEHVGSSKGSVIIIGSEDKKPMERINEIFEFKPLPTMDNPWAYFEKPSHKRKGSREI